MEVMTMKKFNKVLALCLALVMVVGCFAACGETTPDDPKAENIKVALICLHGDSSTYDKNFIDAFKLACENKGLTADDYTIVTDIPEDTACYDQAADLAESYDLIFADSFGHESHMIKAAKEFPEVEFCHATGTRAHTENLPNFHNAFASIYEGRYLAGVAAGMKLVELYGDDEGKVSDENAKIGYVGAFPYAEVISGYTSFYLGAKSIVENATMEVRYTNSWYDETAEKTTALALIDAGCKLISQHADSWGAPTACEEKNIPNVSYNGSTEEKCPNTFIIASRINWAPYFEYIIDCVQNDKAIDTDWTGTLATGSVEITALGGAAAKGTQDKLDEVKKGLQDGTIKVFDCSTFTVEGKELTSFIADVDDAGDYKPETEVVETANDITFINESAKRSAPYFNIIIDGITAVTE
jgi:basic membrane protein A